MSNWIVCITVCSVDYAPLMNSAVHDLVWRFYDVHSYYVSSHKSVTKSCLQARRFSNGIVPVSTADVERWKTQVIFVKYSRNTSASLAKGCRHHVYHVVVLCPSRFSDCLRFFCRYFEDDDEDQKNLSELEYQPAPGSPTLDRMNASAANQKDDDDSSSTSSDDPLDSFMADIEVRCIELICFRLALCGHLYFISQLFWQFFTIIIIEKVTKAPFSITCTVKFLIWLPLILAFTAVKLFWHSLSFAFLFAELVQYTSAPNNRNPLFLRSSMVLKFSW